MKYLIYSALFLFTVSMSAQSILNADSPEKYRKERDENKYRTYKDKNSDVTDTIQNFLPYGFIEPKDEMWSKVTWEVIDLNERLNQIYFHNSDGLISSNLSLFEALKKGMLDGEITEVYEDEYFKDKLDPKEAISRLSAQRVDEYAIEDMINQGMEPTEQDIADLTDNIEIRSDKVEMIMIKGMWYMDKRLGEMKYRLLGLSILGPDVQTIGRGIEGGDELLSLFWVWYPSARETLSKYVVFNPKNNSSRVSYDDLLNARMFNSVIYKSESGFGSGNIEEYLPADAEAQIRESDRIKKGILDMENQMWHY